MNDPNDAAIEALRTAVSVSPDNEVLVHQLIKLLVDLLRYDEAEQATRKALQYHRGSVVLQLTLADIYFRQGKDSHALAIVETLAVGKDADPRAMVMHARLLQRGGDIRAAVSTYREAVARDEDVADSDLASLLGIQDFSDEDSGVVPDFRDAIAEFADHVEDEEDDAPVSVQSERPEQDFASVGGMEGVKDEIRVKIIYPLQHADMYAAYGKKSGGEFFCMVRRDVAKRISLERLRVRSVLRSSLSGSVMFFRCGLGAVRKTSVRCSKRPEKVHLVSCSLMRWTLWVRVELI